MADEILTAEKLRTLLEYDPTTGNFRYLKSLQGRNPGDLAGNQDQSGYRMHEILGRKYRAHRLAWLYMTGEWPPSNIDHINGSRGDNKWGNLRLASGAINAQNLRKAHKRNQTGLLGVSVKKGHGNKPFGAKIRANGKYIHIGYFRTPEEAHGAYVEAKRRLHQGCTL